VEREKIDSTMFKVTDSFIPTLIDALHDAVCASKQIEASFQNQIDNKSSEWWVLTDNKLVYLKVSSASNQPQSQVVVRSYNRNLITKIEYESGVTFFSEPYKRELVNVKIKIIGEEKEIVLQMPQQRKDQDMFKEFCAHLG
jgi:hypothetical protein